MTHLSAIPQVPHWSFKISLGIQSIAFFLSSYFPSRLTVVLTQPINDLLFEPAHTLVPQPTNGTVIRCDGDLVHRSQWTQRWFVHSKNTSRFEAESRIERARRGCRSSQFACQRRSCVGPVSLLRGQTGRSGLEAVQATRLTVTACKRRKKVFQARFGDRLEGCTDGVHRDLEDWSGAKAEAAGVGQTPRLRDEHLPCPASHDVAPLNTAVALHRTLHRNPQDVPSLERPV